MTYRWTRSTLLALALVTGCADDPTDQVTDTDTDSVGDTDTTAGDTDGVETDIPLPEGVDGVDCSTPGVCILSGTIRDDLTLTPTVAWLLSGGVIVGDDEHTTTLTITPGTTIYGETATGGFLNVARHSRLEAVGTADRPIVFTSDQVEGERVRGNWGGVVLRGLAPINVCTAPPAGGAPCEADLEGGAGRYGGGDAHDDSGTLRYVRVEFAGYAISPDNELNGLTLGGVGDGTTIEYVQVHKGNDDGVEFFGGTVGVKHVVITCPTDDGLDWDNGFSGKVQHAVVVQCAEGGDTGMEGDNHPTNFTVEPLSSPTFSNITLIGGSPVSTVGMMIRRGTQGTFANILVTNFRTACVSLRDQATIDHLTVSGGFDHVLLDCDTAFEDNDFDDDAGTLFAAGAGNQVEVADLKLNATAWTTDLDFAPEADSPAATGGAAPSGSFFDPVGYVGAFAPGGTPWTEGWTTLVAD